MRIVTECVVSSAHRLPGYEGKCKNLHGHNWRVRVVIDGWPIEHSLSPYAGMIMDFSFIKQVVNTLDHTYLNDIIPNPTAENISIWVCRELMKVADNVGNVESVIVQVFETEKSYAQVSSKELAERMNKGIVEPMIVDEPNKDIGTQVVDEESEDDEGEREGHTESE